MEMYVFRRQIAPHNGINENTNAAVTRNHGSKVPSFPQDLLYLRASGLFLSAISGV